MPCHTGPLSSAGAVIPLSVSGSDIPMPVDTLALIDTGANMSCINRSFALGIGLRARGMEFVSSLVGDGESFVYTADLLIPVRTVAGPTHYLVSCVPLLEFPQDRQYKILLGWDVVKDGQLWINGLARSFSLCF